VSKRPRGRKDRTAGLPRSSEPTDRYVGDPGKDIQQFIDILKRNDLAELEWETAGLRIHLKRETAHPAPVAISREIQSAAREPLIDKGPLPAPFDQTGKVTVTSPIVGTFYRSPSPDADPYVEEGDTVKKGQVLCIVEAMKLMNEIESEVDGTIVKILAESTKPVEYGQPLFLIEPGSGA
jgi:acetyl-CoA carboxylase biotin carboxyl carrier protein